MALVFLLEPNFMHFMFQVCFATSFLLFFFSFAYIRILFLSVFFICLYTFNSLWGMLWDIFHILLSCVFIFVVSFFMYWRSAAVLKQKISEFHQFNLILAHFDGFQWGLINVGQCNQLRHAEVRQILTDFSKNSLWI